MESEKIETLKSLDKEDIGNTLTDVYVVAKKIIFAAPGGNFTIFSGGKFSVKSTLGVPVAEGMVYKISGKIGEYRGMPQLVAESIEMAESKKNIEAAICEFFKYKLKTDKLGNLRKAARDMGENILKDIRKSPDKFKETYDRIPEDLADAVITVAKKKENDKTLELFLIGLSAETIRRIGHSSIDTDTIRHNPYLLYFEDIASFRECELIAKKYNVPTDNPDRTQALFLSGIDEVCMSSGATYTTLEGWEKFAKKGLAEFGASAVPEDKLCEAIAEAANFERAYIYKIEDNKIKLCDIADPDARISSSRTFNAEVGIAKAVKEFVNAKKKIPVREEADRIINEIATKEGIELDETQSDALYMAMFSPMCIITGGPGTGKTTIMGILTKFFESRKIKCEFAAPTGRAAKRLSESTGKDAKTIHRLLGLTPENVDTDYKYGDHKVDPIFARVVVIDEMSMVDIHLFVRLMDAIPDDCSVILVGDPNQLPSVGPGNVLADLLKCKKIPHTELKYTHRQDGDSSIPANANRILEGDTNLVSDADNFTLIETQSDDEAWARLLNISTKLEENNEDYIVLTPTKKENAVLSTGNLNEKIQSLRIPADKVEEYFSYGKHRFYVGDRVMQTRNNYDLGKDDEDQEETGVFNGELGVVTKITDSTVTVEFDDGKIIKYAGKDAADLTLAYAVTIHKSQGCEFDTVVIVLGSGVSVMLKRRRLFYTAVTRGKSRVYVIDVRQSVDKYITNQREEQRQSSLADFLGTID